MATTPSNILLAKDAIGHALNISTIKAKQDRAQLINDYNMAIAEIYLILGYIDTEAYLELSPNLSTTMNGFPKAGIVDISALNWDKIFSIEIKTNSDPSLPVDNADEVPYSLLSSHRAFQAAIDPYDECIIYSVVKDRIHFLIGSSLTYAFNTILFQLAYRRQPTILVLNQYDFEKVDLPDKYISLLQNRIASLIEYRAGVFDKALAMVKVSYEQLLGNVEPVIKASLLETLKAPVGAIQ